MSALLSCCEGDKCFIHHADVVLACQHQRSSSMKVGAREKQTKATTSHHQQ